MRTKMIYGDCVAAVLSVLFLGLSGCGGNDQPDLGLVKGTITLDGKPLAGVEVLFQPDGGRPSTGRTDSEGKYELRYIRETMGAKVGRNRVEIAPTEEIEEDEAPLSEEETAAPAPAVLSGKPVIPRRYNSRSELTADVKPGENTFDFALESK